MRVIRLFLLVFLVVVLVWPAAGALAQTDVFIVDFDGDMETATRLRFNDGRWQYHIWTGWHDVSWAITGSGNYLNYIPVIGLSSQTLEVLNNLNGASYEKGRRYLTNILPTTGNGQYEVTGAGGYVAGENTGLNKLKPQLQVNFGDSKINLEAINCPPGSPCTIGWIGDYIKAVYNYGVGLAGILAAVMIMAAGFLWLTSAGSPDRVGQAKEMITAALSGLLLALFSYIILYAVNPRLTVFDAVKLDVPVIIELGGGGEPAVIGAATQGSYGGTVAAGTNQALANISGHERLNGSNQDFINGVDQLIDEMSEDGTLPAGFRITSGLRPDSITSTGAPSQHATGQAVDMAWPGINAENAQTFIDNARQTSMGANFQFIREVTPSEMQHYGSTGPHVHGALPRRR